MGEQLFQPTLEARRCWDILTETGKMLLSLKSTFKNLQNF